MQFCYLIAKSYKYIINHFNTMYVIKALECKHNINEQRNTIIHKYSYHFLKLYQFDSATVQSSVITLYLHTLYLRPLLHSTTYFQSTYGYTNNKIKYTYKT